MKTILKLFLFLAVIVIQSCSEDNDTVCPAVLCAQPAVVLDFKIVDAETGENIIGSIIPSESIKVTNTSTDVNVDFQIINENDFDLLRIYLAETDEYEVIYEDEEIFSFSAEVERKAEECCDTAVLNNLSIQGADFEMEEETGIYIIKKTMRSNTTSGESLENYHSFFENSKLQIESEDHDNTNEESLKIDVLEGNKLVFKLLQYEDPLPEIADDEITRIVYFEVDPEATEFKLNKDNFAEANAVIGLSASVSFIKFIKNGEITGTKISNEEWQVAINVAAGDEDQENNITVEEAKTAFTRSTYEDVWMPIYYTHVFN